MAAKCIQNMFRKFSIFTFIIMFFSDLLKIMYKNPISTIFVIGCPIVSYIRLSNVNPISRVIASIFISATLTTLWMLFRMIAIEFYDELKFELIKKYNEYRQTFERN